MTESSSISRSICCFIEQAGRDFSIACPISRKSGPFGASEGLNPRALQVNEALEVVASGHHGHGKVGAGLADDAHQLATHLGNGTEHMFHTCSRLGDAAIAPFLAVGKMMVKEGPLLRALEFGDVPGPQLVRGGGQQFGFGVLGCWRRLLRSRSGFSALR